MRYPPCSTNPRMDIDVTVGDRVELGVCLYERVDGHRPMVPPLSLGQMLEVKSIVESLCSLHDPVVVVVDPHTHESVEYYVKLTCLNWRGRRPRPFSC